MSDFKVDDRIDAPVAPAHRTELIKDRRRLGRIHDVNPALIPLLRDAATVAIVDNFGPISVADVIVPTPGVVEVALRPPTVR
jgi:hypothetical protein